MRSYLKFLCILIVFNLIHANAFPQGQKFSTHFFDIRSVTFTGGLWKQKIQINSDSSIPHCIEQCIKRGRLENFKHAATHSGTFKGLFPFDDSDIYKTIEAVSYDLAIKDNPAFTRYLDSAVTLISKAQEPDGYIQTMWSIDSLHPKGGMGKRRLENERFGSHELYNVGCLYEAAVALYKYQNRSELLEVAKRNADFMYKTILLGKRSIASGHPEIEIGLLKLYAVTGKKNYIDLAQYLIDERGNPDVDRPYINKWNPWSWPINLVDHKRVKDFDSADGHVLRAMFLYIGVLDIIEQTHDVVLKEAMLKVWKNLISKKLYITGGTGSNHKGEAFSSDYDLPNLNAYSEGCASVGNILYQTRLYAMNGNPMYIDILERTLYNSFLAITSANGKKFFYVNPLESDTVFKFNHGSCERQPWFDVPCCPPSVARLMPQLGAWQYAFRNDTLFVNLFSSNKAVLSFNGINVSISQTTDYPWNGKIAISVVSDKPLNISLRIPNWVNQEPIPSDLYQFISGSPKSISLKHNGINVDVSNRKSGYINLKVPASTKNTIEYVLPLQVQYVKSNYNVIENTGLVALTRGPLVYCTENYTETNIFKNLALNSSKKEQLSENVVKNSVEIIYKSEKNENYKFIPYYQWANNGNREMKIWLKDDSETKDMSYDIKPIPKQKK